MTDPSRWSEAGDSATETEQLLVRSGQEFSMPEAEKHAVWRQIVVALPPGVDLTLPQRAAAAKPGSWLALKWLKLIGLVVVASGVTIAGHHWLEKRSAVIATAPQSSFPSPGIQVPAKPTVSANASPITTDTVAPGPTPKGVPSAILNRASSLHEESLAVIAARQALRANDAVSALRLLEQAQQRFKKGALIEERESLTIEALAKSGQVSRASTRARAFLTRYPRSPHAADVQRYVSE